MPPEYDQVEVSKAFEVIRAAMVKDCPEQPGSYAHSWHCNIAMMCYDAIRGSDKNQLGHNTAHEIGNDAASRFMKVCFVVVTKA